MTSRRQEAAEPEFLLQVGETLRTLRARRGMTRRALAAQSRVSERYIAQMEAGSGNASLLVARALATALGFSPPRMPNRRCRTACSAASSPASRRISARKPAPFSPPASARVPRACAAPAWR
jgi:transcriptional regulator with XRE-family HTH domain